MASAAAILGSISRHRAFRSRLLELVLLVTLVLCLAALLTLLAEVGRGAMHVFQTRGLDVVQASLSSLPQRAGLWQGIVGSAITMLVVVLVAFPLGVAAAVYLEEYARDTRLTRFISLNVRNLAGAPSIVYGLLGLSVFVTTLRSFTGGPSMISAGLTLAALVLPIVIITTAEALRAVPSTIREAAYGLGATDWQVIRGQVLPAALPGILTGTVLSLSRALGETAPLLLVGAVTGFLGTGTGGIAERLTGPFTSLPTIVFAWARQPNIGFRELTSAAIVILLVVILIANGTAIWLRNRYDQRW